ncbi:MAG TPA: hypothetical protein VK213_13165 [Bacteroidales bacterium]|nr:hypothetical protein [Bacteroidales bacterium]
MKTKSLLIVLFLIIAGVAQAQENKTEKESKGSVGMGMGMDAGIQSCMDQIVTDKSLSKEMMTRIMDNMKGDTAAMKDMCRTMMKDPEMHKMMMDMMNKGGMGSGMGNMMEDEDMNHMDHMGSDSTMNHLP